MNRFSGEYRKSRTAHTAPREFGVAEHSDGVPNPPDPAPPPEEVIEEVITRLLELEERAYDIFASIREKKKELIRVRFQQGALVHRVAEEDGYGSREIARLSERTGISDSTLYEAKQFFELSQFGQSLGRLNAWLSREEERKGRVTWSYCRKLVRQGLKEGGDVRLALDRRSRTISFP